MKGFNTKLKKEWSCKKDFNSPSNLVLVRNFDCQRIFMAYMSCYVFQIILIGPLEISYCKLNLTSDSAFSSFNVNVVLPTSIRKLLCNHKISFSLNSVMYNRAKNETWTWNHYFGICFSFPSTTRNSSFFLFSFDSSMAALFGMFFILNRRRDNDW